MIAIFVLLALLGVYAIAKRPEHPDATDVPPEKPTRLDPGNSTRADRLIGTLPGVIVSNANIASLNGFHNWRDRYDREIYYLCDTRYRLVTPVLVKAIMDRESNFNPNAVRVESKINDKSIGLMQVLTETAKWIAPFRDLTKQQIEEKLYDPITNISVGTKYILWQLGRYGRDNEGTKKAISAYNAGSAIYGENGRFVNRAYVSSILGRMKVYANDFPPLRTK